MTRRRLRPVATVAASLICALAGGVSRAEDADMASPASSIWTCHYIARTPDRPLQITATFSIVGHELAEIETIPRGL
jgi:hypothetical protein